MVVERTWIFSGSPCKTEYLCSISVSSLVFLYVAKPMKWIYQQGMLETVQVQISFWRVQLLTYKWMLLIKTAEPINCHWLRIFLNAVFQQLWKTNCIFSGIIATEVQKIHTSVLKLTWFIQSANTESNRLLW